MREPTHKGTKWIRQRMHYNFYGQGTCQGKSQPPESPKLCCKAGGLQKCDEGAPTAVTAYFSIVPKPALMVVVLPLLYQSFNDFLAEWQPESCAAKQAGSHHTSASRCMWRSRMTAA